MSLGFCARFCVQTERERARVLELEEYSVSAIVRVIDGMPFRQRL